MEVRALEVRDPNPTFSAPWSGYYEAARLPEAAQAIATQLDGRAVGVYQTLNPVNPALLARAANRLIKKPRHTTTDVDIMRRYWLPIDCDPIRPAGISATDAELATALACRDDVVKFLNDLDFPEPLRGMSGNGGHALYRIDEPNDAETARLIQEALLALKARFPLVDGAVSNASRIWKIPGTLTCKGDATPDRPHRRATLESVPLEEIVVPRAALAQLAQMTASSTSSPGWTRVPDPRDERDDLDVLEAFKVRGWYRGPGVKAGQHFTRCPWDSAEDTRQRQTAIYEPTEPGGPWGFHCFHAACASRTIKDVYRLLRAGASAGGRTAGRAGEREAGEGGEPWPAPTPISTKLSPVPAFDLALLPPAIADWVQDIARRVSCPIDYVAVTIMVVLGSVVGRQLGVCPKEHDDWVAVPNLWGRVIGPPGVLKSPALREAMRPLSFLIAEAKAAYQQALKDYEFAKMTYDAERKKLDKQLKDAVAGDQDLAAVRAAFEALTEPLEPTERRYLVNDATIEKLGELLNENPNGLLQFRDEDAGFLHSMDREGNENARAFFCEGWNGNGSYTYDRIERGTIYIAACCLSKLGSIQPGPMRHYLQEVFGSGERDDGFVQRDQLMVFPEVPDWEDVDEIPDSAARQRVTTILRRLAALDLVSIGAHRDEKTEIPYLRFTPEAQAHFRRWRAALEHRIRHGEDHSTVVNHLAKYRSLMPSLALLIHLVACVDRGSGGPVSEAAALQAIQWCDYLEPHARRVYENLTAAGRLNAAYIAGKLTGLRAGDLPNPFRARSVQLKGWAGLTNAEAVKEALEILEEHHYVRRAPHGTTSKGGRPTEDYLVNPAIVRGWR